MNTSSVFSRREFARRSVIALGLPLVASGADDKTAKPVRHRFLCCDYQGNKVSIVAADGSVEWEYPTQTPQDCWMLPNGNVLFCYTHGAQEVSRDKKVVWE